jgi:endonuclease/exonuclease/phosphatase (EEP) superfamily protein YafD
MATCFVILLSMLGYLARQSWMGEIACHFRTQYAILLALAMLLLLYVREKAKASVVAIFVVANISSVATLYIPVRRTFAGHSELLSVLSANVHADNEQQLELIQHVLDVRPDFVFLFEAGEKWKASLERLKQEYPSVEEHTQSEHFSIVVLSRFPIQLREWKRFGSSSVFAVVAQTTIHGRPLSLIGCHVLPPTSREYFRLRNLHLSEVADAAARSPDPVVLVGDLNVSANSPFFGDILRRGNLRNSRRGFGVQPTWPVGFPGLRIPIDHCLVSADIDVHGWSRGPDIGSDHFPIIVEFSIGRSSE